MRPILGSVRTGGGVYDYTTGQALYGVEDGGVIKCFRTTDGFRSLATKNGSVEFIANIVDPSIGTFILPTTVYLQRINGTIYANVTGKTSQATTGKVYHRIYKDTSGGAGTSWALHSTIWDFDAANDGWFGSPPGLSINGYPGGEILVSGSTWVTGSFVRLGNFGGQTTTTRHGLWASTNAGGSWFNVLDIGFHIIGGPYGRSQSRSFGYRDGKWYFGVSGQGGASVHHSSNLTSWTGWSDGNSDTFGPSWPMSVDGSKIYRQRVSNIAWTESAPETNPSYTTEFDMTAMGMQYDANIKPSVFNAGPDEAPFWCMESRGTVLGLVSGGWQTGSLAFS